MMGLLKFILGLVGVLWLAIAGAGAMYWWQTRPADVPAPIVFKVAFWPVKIGFPPSLKAQLAAHDVLLAQAVANERTLTKALNDQSTRVRALSAAGAGLRVEAAKAATVYRDALARQAKPEARILAAGQGPGNVCTRAEAVDAAFLESLR